ncbi:MAG: Fic family protein [Phycisphaerae bacterium]|nr:Fic family protein [Phycisphaerae bacterium]
MAKASGRLVRCVEGYSAFVPNPLPPDLNWSPRIIRALSDADRLVGRLAGQGARLPNPHLLMRPFLRREAVLSSRIEGTQATLGELLAAEAGAAVERSPGDLREVGNYVAALEHGLRRLHELPLSLRLVRELHGVLMEGVRGEHATPGEFRHSQNWIGPPGCTLANAGYVPPPPSELMNCLAEWERALRDASMPPLLHAGLIHYQFEAIHPFLDGNGRVGRLLITLLLVERDVLPTPLLYLSAFFEATRRDYYDLLLAVSRESKWEDWLEYFLNGVARQSEDAVGRAERISQLLDQWRLKVAGSASKTPALLLDMIAENPFVTANRAAERLRVAFTTAQRAIRKLKDASIIEEVGDARRDRVYCAKAILDILEEPARLKPG